MLHDHYDYLIVGAGITSAVFAHEAALQDKTCLVIDRRDHIAGNIYTATNVASMFMRMALTSSIPLSNRYGIT
ncbi:MAG: NAD(P)-binding protein [Eggerthellaceae bacterium]